jgi:hypothetical protein
VTKVVDFKCIKVQNEIDWFVRTSLVPVSLQSGEISIRDVEQCLDTMDLPFKKSGVKLINAFVKTNAVTGLHAAAIREYDSLYNNLKSKNRRFKFSQVLDNYRMTINPLTAFYYECREMRRVWDPSNGYHSWLLRTAQDHEFYSCIVKALDHDLEALTRYTNRYYWLLLYMKKEMPIEVYHAKQFMEDLNDYREFFTELREWTPPTT